MRAVDPRDSSPSTSLPPLPLGEVRATVAAAVQRGADRAWSMTDIDWEGVRQDALTDVDRSVVRFITFIEDHIPEYLTQLLEVFPTAGKARDVDEYCVNREYFRWFISWANDEERHAASLTRYQVAAGIAQEDDLLRELATEGQKHFDLPYDHPIQAFTYTLLQEKATQLFYQRFLSMVTEPVLHGLLQRLARDEARHFALYSSLISDYVRRHSAEAVPHLKHVVNTFRMPLATTLTGYRRWSYDIAEATSYDHTEAYDALNRLVREFTRTPGEADNDDLARFVAQVGRVP